MNVSTVLNNTLSLVTFNMHKIQCSALSARVHSLVNGGAATATSMGRGISSKAHEKHDIKGADRLCSNPHLLLESVTIYTMICNRFGRFSPLPVILVDWSDLDEYKRHFLLRSSLAYEGRSITHYKKFTALKPKKSQRRTNVF